MSDPNSPERRPSDDFPPGEPPSEDPQRRGGEAEEEWTWEPPRDGRVFGVDDDPTAPQTPTGEVPAPGIPPGVPPEYRPPQQAADQYSYSGQEQSPPQPSTWQAPPPQDSGWQQHAHHGGYPPAHAQGYGATTTAAPAAVPFEKDSVKLVVGLIVAMTTIFLVACLGPCAILGVVPGGMVVWIALQEKRLAAQYGQKNRIAELTLWLGVKVIVLSVLMAILSILLMVLMPDLAEQFMQMSGAAGA